MASRPAAAPGSSTRSILSKSRARSTCSHRAQGAVRRRASQPIARLVRGLHPLDDDAPIRHRRARREEQPRHLLGDAGRGVCVADGRRASSSRCAARDSRPCCCRRRWRPTAAFRSELARTKPYGYSLFNLDAMATVVSDSRCRCSARTSCGRSSCRTAAGCDARSRS